MNNGLKNISLLSIVIERKNEKNVKKVLLSGEGTFAIKQNGKIRLITIAKIHDEEFSHYITIHEKRNKAPIKIFELYITPDGWEKWRYDLLRS